MTTITLARHEADALSTPAFLHQRYFVDMDRFLLIESVIHLIDVTRFLGGEINEITCNMRPLSGKTKAEFDLTQSSECMNTSQTSKNARMLGRDARAKR